MTTAIWLNSLLTAIALFQIVAIPALLLRKNDLADVLWGPAFPICAFSALFFSGTEIGSLDTRKWVALALLVFWATRLFLHVGWRNLSHLSKEDVRYNNWRKQWGSTWLWRSYLQVFVLQALILFIFLVPANFILASPAKPIGFIGYAGIGLWLIGMFFEAVGDEQLRRFKANPGSKGKLMTTGLWSWTRHPNYFGEVLLWWGFWLITIELPGAWWTILGPLGVSYLLWNVSGVAMLEELMKTRSGFAEYEKSVSKFFPRPPKRAP